MLDTVCSKDFANRSSANLYILARRFAIDAAPITPGVAIPSPIPPDTAKFWSKGSTGSCPRRMASISSDAVSPRVVPTTLPVLPTRGVKAGIFVAKAFAAAWLAMALSIEFSNLFPAPSAKPRTALSLNMEDKRWGMVRFRGSPSKDCDDPIVAYVAPLERTFGTLID